MTKRSYTQVARAAGAQRTRTALLDAARDEFFAGRWVEVPLETIAARAGVTKQTLLRHFGSKDRLLAATYERAADAVRAQRFSAPTDDIDGAVDNLLDHYEEHGARSLSLGGLSGSPAIVEMVQAARQSHYDWVEHAFGAWLKDVPRVERAQRRAALIALCDVHTWSILARDLGLPRRQVRATLTLAIRRLLEVHE